MEIQQGKYTLIYVQEPNGTRTKFGCLINASANISVDSTEAPGCFDDLTSASKNFIPGQYSWTVSGDGNYRLPANATEEAANVTYKDLVRLAKAGTLVTVSWASNGTSTRYEGQAFITSVDWNAPGDNLITFSMSLQGTGDLNIVDPA